MLRKKSGHVDSDRYCPLLSGKALAAYAKAVTTEAKEDYYSMKEALLQPLKKTSEQCTLDIGLYTRSMVKHGRSGKTDRLHDF